MLAAVLCAAFWSTPLHAVEIPVHYFVEEKPLKQSASSGTPLTFSWWTDRTCCEDPFECDDFFPGVGESTAIAIDDLTLLSRVKPLTPKGGTKVPNTVELRATIDVGERGPIYLRVSGPGVVPVGDACQVQSATASAASGSLFTASVPAFAADPDYQLVGPRVTVRDNQRVFGTVTAQLGRTLVAPTLKYDLCYYNPAGSDPPTPFTPGGGLTVSLQASTRTNLTAAASALLPLSSLAHWEVGFCILTSGPLDLNGGVSGWIKAEDRDPLF